MNSKPSLVRSEFLCGISIDIRSSRGFWCFSMKEVYFDTNVYDLLDELLQAKNFAPVNKLKRAIRSDQVRVYTNLVPIEETLGALKNQPVEGRRRLRLIKTLAKRKRMIRRHTEIIINDISSYAKRERVKSKFMSPYPELKAVFQVRDLPGLVEVAEENRSHNRGFRDEMRDKLFQHIAPLAQPIIENKKVPQFEEYFEANYRGVLEIIADRAGYLEACRERGIEGLLKIPSLNVAVRGQLSLTYANTFLGRLAQQGDSADMQHAFIAVTVGTLVTEDKALGKALKRANSPYLSIMNLQALLDSLP